MSKKYDELQMLKQLVYSQATEAEADSQPMIAVNRVLDLMYESAQTVNADELYDAIAGAFTNDTTFDLGDEA